MRIEKIQVKNFKSIEDSGEIAVSPLFALIGKNNSGKSALAEALLCFWDPKQINARHYHKDCNDPIEIAIKVSNRPGRFDEPVGEKVMENEILCRISKSEAKPEYLLNGKKTAQKDVIALLPQLLFIPAIRNPQNETTAGAKSYLKMLTGSMVNLAELDLDLKEVGEMKAKELSLEQINALMEAHIRSRVAAVSNSLSGYFRETIADESLGLEVAPEGNLAKAISFTTRLRDPHLGPDLPNVDILDCGTGLQSVAILAILQTYAASEQKADIILLVEEPEVYLHPELQRKMFAALRKIAKKNQVIYTTHSPIMISELWADESVKLVKRQDGKSTFSDVDISQIISELGIRYDDVLNSEKVVFVEGDDDAYVFDFIVNALDQNLPATTKKVKFIPSDGFDNIHTYALVHILLSDKVHSNFYLIADNDRVPIREEILAEKVKKKAPKDKLAMLEDLKSRIFILSGHELEWYFLDPEMLGNVFPDIDQKELAEFTKFYFQKYNKMMQQVKDENARAKFCGDYKPSLLFKSPGNGWQYKRLSQAYDNNEAFMKTWTKVASAWGSKLEAGRPPIQKLTQGVDIKKNPLFGGLTAVIEKIINP